MRILSLLIISLFVITISYSDESKTFKILKNLRCLVCQGQTISDSNSDFALTIKEVWVKKKFIIFYRTNMETGFYLIHHLKKIVISYGSCHMFCSS